MSIEQTIHESLSGSRVRDHDGYSAFVAKLVQYVGMLEGVRVTERDPQLEKVRETIRQLSRSLSALPEHQRVGWWPYPDEYGVKSAWVQAAIQLGEGLDTPPSRPQQLAPALEYVAGLWEEHFGKPPGFGENSPFLPLFVAVLPQFHLDAKTARKLLK